MTIYGRLRASGNSKRRQTQAFENNGDIFGFAWPGIALTLLFAAPPGFRLAICNVGPHGTWNEYASWPFRPRRGSGPFVIRLSAPPRSEAEKQRFLRVCVEKLPQKIGLSSLLGRRGTGKGAYSTI